MDSGQCHYYYIITTTVIEINCIRTPEAHILYKTTWKLHKLSFAAYGKFLSYITMLRLTHRRRQKNNYMSKLKNNNGNEINDDDNGDSYHHDNYGDDKLI